MFEFRITSRDRQTAARTGVFYTPHGSFRTPVFMPVGTYGAVKTVTPTELRAAGAEIILGNTFHLHLRPGEATVKKLGGLAEFSRWGGPTLTDSGGFQVFSLAKHRKIYDDRVEFRAPLDGSLQIFTPESALAIQRALGSDIAMQLDECAPGDASRAVAERALTRTMRWAEQSVRANHRYAGKQALFPIIQGAAFTDLRQQSARFCAELPTAGVAIGGLAVGETKRQFLAALDAVAPLLPEHKPHYLMGIGEVSDIFQSVARGVDMFDCVIPTRLARHGAFFDARGKRCNIRHTRYKLDKKPLDPACRCPACTGGFSRGYLRHLFITGEILGLRLLTLHNLTFMFQLLAQIRTAIRTNALRQLAREYGVSL